MGKAQLTAPIARIVESGPIGMSLWLDDLVKQTGGSYSGIRRVMRNLVDEARVTETVTAQCWVINRPSAGQEVLYSQIGVTAEGRPIIQDEDGRLFIAKEIAEK